MRFTHGHGEYRPVFSAIDVFILKKICEIVRSLPDDMTYTLDEKRVPVCAKLVTFALAEVLGLELHVGFDIVHPNNRIAWYWLVTKSGAYIDIDPRLIRGSDGPAIIHSDHPFRGLHTYRTTSVISSYNMYFTARGVHGFTEWNAVLRLVLYIQQNMHGSVELVRISTQGNNILESV